MGHSILPWFKFDLNFANWLDERYADVVALLVVCSFPLCLLTLCNWDLMNYI